VAPVGVVVAGAGERRLLPAQEPPGRVTVSS